MSNFEQIAARSSATWHLRNKQTRSRPLRSLSHRIFERRGDRRPRFEKLNGQDQAAFIVSTNVARRNLNVSQLSLLKPRIEVVSVGAVRKIPDIEKSRPETGAGRPSKNCRNLASQGLGEASPMACPDEPRTPRAVSRENPRYPTWYWTLAR